MGLSGPNERPAFEFRGVKGQKGFPGSRLPVSSHVGLGRLERALLCFTIPSCSSAGSYLDLHRRMPSSARWSYLRVPSVSPGLVHSRPQPLFVICQITLPLIAYGFHMITLAASFYQTPIPTPVLVRTCAYFCDHRILNAAAPRFILTHDPWNPTKPITASETVIIITR